jgi:2-polyprenyl-3-methyl-5-hydroxy-6-metoxy-1,4-benzoquinol methylase
MNYDELYNGPNSHKKADDSWNRYMDPVDKRDQTRERYEYSVSYLYGDVLDVGAGDGFGAYLMQGNKSITSITCVEVHDESIKRIKHNVGIKAVKVAAEEMNFDRKFDSIHCGHTLEHVENLYRTLENIKRHAKDIVVISVPIRGGISHIHLREWRDSREAFEMVEKHFEIKEWYMFKKDNIVSSAVFITKVYA